LYSPQRIEEGLLAHAPAAPGPIVLSERPEWALGSMVRRSPLLQRLFSRMRCTARHLRIATIEGESGTGKMLAAQTLHIGSASAGPFIPCPAVQFFQHGPSPASLTPLMRDARDGTPFLSHVEELSLEQRARLLALMPWFDHQQASRMPDSVPRQIFSAPTKPSANSPLLPSSGLIFGGEALREEIG
jgi:two-component system response regulator AtoC